MSIPLTQGSLTLGSRHTSAMVKNAAMNMGVQISLQSSAFSSLGSILRSGRAGAHGNFILNFWRNRHTVSIAAAPFYILSSNARAFQFRILTKNFFFFSLVAALIGVRWHLTMVLVCISLTISDIEHRHTWPLVYPLWRLSLQVLCPFCNWVVCLFVFSVSL